MGCNRAKTITKLYLPDLIPSYGPKVITFKLQNWGTLTNGCGNLGPPGARQLVFKWKWRYFAIVHCNIVVLWCKAFFCVPDKSKGHWQCLPGPLWQTTAQSEDNSSLILMLSEESVTPSPQKDRRAAATAAAWPHKSTQTLQWCLQRDDINRKSRVSHTHKHTHTVRRRVEHVFSRCQGHSTSMAAVIIMISSNEGATGVNATRLFSLTQPVITTFCFSLWLTHVLALTLVLHHVILFQSQPCHAALSPAWQCWQGRPKNWRNTKEPSQLWHRRGRCAADEVCNTTYPLWLVCQRCCFFVREIETWTKFVLVGKFVTKKKCHWFRCKLSQSELFVKSCLRNCA